VNTNSNAASIAFAETAELALQLHLGGGSELRIDLPADSILRAAALPYGCRLENDVLEFSSLKERNAIVAEGAFEKLRSPSGVDPSTLFDLAYKLWRHEIGHEDQASGRLLALASGNVDILAVGALRIRSGSRAFDVLHLVEAALPYLSKIDVRSLIDLCEAKYEHIKNDMMGDVVHGALETWLEARPNDAKELHAKVLENLSEATAGLLGNAVVALSKTDYPAAAVVAKTDARSAVGTRAQVGAWTLGRLLLDDRATQESLYVVVDEIIELIESQQGELRSQVIRAAVGAMHAIQAFDPVLQRLAERGDQDVLCAAARTLFLKDKEIYERGITPIWIRMLTALRPEFKGAIRDFDYALSRMLGEASNTETVVSVLSQWVSNHGHKSAIDSETAELFDDTLRMLLARDESSSLLVTNWLLSDQQEHASALGGALIGLSHHSEVELRLDKSRIDQLTANDLLFLARRMLGYVHDRAQLTSLSLSMLQSKDVEIRIYPVLSALLVQEIGYDYPGSTIETLRATAETTSSKNDKDFLLKAAEGIEQVVDAQNALPSLSELRPPTMLRRFFSRARAKQMDASVKEANKNSFWRQIATEIPIKAGTGTFSYRDSNYGPSTKFSSMSHSIELPRREAFDPIGNSIRHIGFRIAKRGKA
jgi:hypothetical protein